MGMISKIEWCDATWNPVVGCAPVSPGCANCYASALSVRWGKGKYGATRERTLASKGTLRLPYRLNHRAKDRPTRLFTASLSDVFDPVWPVDGHIRLLTAIEKCRQVNFILVTKRPELWRTVLERVTSSPASRLPEVLQAAEFAQSWLDGKAPDNVCVMASVEDQSYALRRIPDLLRIPARWHGLSLEPLLGPVDVTNHGLHGAYSTPTTTVEGRPVEWTDPGPGFIGLDWLVIGGESGPKARPCHVDWIRSLVRQGLEAGAAVFVKQLGSMSVSDVDTVPDRSKWRGIKGVAGRTGLAHKKGGDPTEWPADLRIREWPEGL